MKSIFPFIQKIHLRTCIYLIPIYVAFYLTIYQSYCRSIYLSPYLSIPTWAASGLNFAGRVRNSATVFSVVSIHLATDSCNQGLHMHKYLIREQLYNRHLPLLLRSYPSNEFTDLHELKVNILKGTQLPSVFGCLPIRSPLKQAQTCELEPRYT